MPELGKDYSYELYLGLDEPKDGCSRFAERISVRGWLLAPSGGSSSAEGPSENGVPIEFKVLVEEHSGEGPVIRAGLDFLGTELGYESENERPYLERIDISPSMRQESEELLFINKGKRKRRRSCQIAGYFINRGLFVSNMSPKQF